MLDLIIKNCRIIDGSGTPWFYGDVGINDGKIAFAGRVETEAKRVINARGMILSPGFIDAHSHSDLPLLVNGNAESKVRQGVTTEVTGNCGYSPAPIYGEHAEEFAREIKEEYGLELIWSSFGEYLEQIQKNKTSVNVVPLVGHGAIRKSVLGYEDRKPSSEELSEMKNLLKEALDAGAHGFSTGLIYPPSCYADKEELIELARLVAKEGGIYTSHIRYEGEELVEGVREALEIGEKSGVSVQISHHKASHPKSWGLVSGTLRMMEEYRNRGVDVTCDVYPYLATATGLSAIIPAWVHEGGTKKMLSRMENPELRPGILEEIRTEQSPRGWHNIFISSGGCEENRKFEGKNILEISRELGKSPEETVMFLVELSQGNAGMIRFAMCEEDLETVLKSRLSMIGSDGSGLAHYGKLNKGKPHPRNFGTFPRVLGLYCREKKLFKLEDAVHKMTGFPAQRFGLYDRGLIRPGFAADLVIFKEDLIKDNADFVNPFQYPAGIEYVLVNGEIVIEKGEHTGKRPGKLL